MKEGHKHIITPWLSLGICQSNVRPQLECHPVRQEDEASRRVKLTPHMSLTPFICDLDIIPPRPYLISEVGCWSRRSFRNGASPALLGAYFREFIHNSQKSDTFWAGGIGLAIQWVVTYSGPQRLSLNHL